MSDTEQLFADETWDCNNKFLTYTGPHLTHDLNRRDVRRLVRQKRFWGAIWNYDWDCGPEGRWCSFVCDTPGYELLKIKKKTRYYVRRSLSVCEARKIEVDWLAEHGYETYCRAAVRYADYSVGTREGFVRWMRSFLVRPGWEFYGVFVEGVLVAYASLFICGQTVQVRLSKFDPAYSSAFPMYALYYTIAHHYVAELGYKDVDNGWAPLGHDTEIGPFLERLGWRKVHCRLGLYVIWPIRVLLLMIRMFRIPYEKLVPARYARGLKAILWTQDIACGKTVTELTHEGTGEDELSAP